MQGMYTRRYESISNFRAFFRDNDKQFYHASPNRPLSFYKRIIPVMFKINTRILIFNYFHILKVRKKLVIIKI